MWPLVFLSARRKRESLGVIVALDALVAEEVVTAAREDAVAAGRLTANLERCLFATALNGAVDGPSSA